MIRRPPSTAGGRAIVFAAVVFFAPLAVALAAVWAMSPGEGYAAALLLAGGSVSVLGAAWLAVVTWRRARDVPGLVLTAAGIGFGAAAAAGLLVPLLVAVFSAAPSAAAYGALGATVAVGVYLGAGGPVWLAATALLASPLVLPEGRVSARQMGAVLALIGTIVAAGAILITWFFAGRESFSRSCAGSDGAPDIAFSRPDVLLEGAGPIGTFSWFPLGLRCEWPMPGYTHTNDPGWFATIVVVVALAVAALGGALAVRSRAPRSRPDVAVGERWDAPEDPWRPRG